MSSIFLPPEQTRLVTICAHVDHGKTTLADNLIEANGIISERMAGTIRYLDSLEEEQRRGITMKASAIGLKHTYVSKQSRTETIHHLLDSPGHTDFSTEVSSSLQCCDGTLLVVDAVEGMCARTHQVLREAHSHQLVPILVINKVDRLCTDLCLSTTEAHLRLRRLIESVNATTAGMLLSKAAEMNETKAANETMDVDEDEEARWTFDPMKGNVVFASALYGWGFTVPALCRSLFRKKAVSIKPMLLKQYMFGDFKYNNGKVLKWKTTGDADSMFAEFGLQPLWDIYEGVSLASVATTGSSQLFADGRTAYAANNGSEKPNDAKIKATSYGMDQVLSALQQGGTSSQQTPLSTADEMQKILTRTGSSSEEAVLRSLIRRYRPLSDTVLDVVFELCPSPRDASNKLRTRALALKKDDDATGNAEFNAIWESVRSCDASSSANTVAHICKFMSVDRAHIRDPELEDDNSHVILGLARVLSGTLRSESEYYVMGPKHSFKDQHKLVKKSVRLYLLMGSAYVRVNEVPAGHLCAVQNLEDVQLKTATLCDSIHGMPLQGFDQGVRPLVKVNVEATDPADIQTLEHGLLKLSQADGAVEVTATAKGERILACLGELHLEQSILDLQKIYCGNDIKLRISEPIVEFGETTDWFNDELDFAQFCESKTTSPRQSSIPPYNEEEGLESAKLGRSRAVLTGRPAAISLRAIPLSSKIHSALKQGKLASDDADDDLLTLGKALGSASSTPKGIFEQILERVLSIDENGNAMIAPPSLSSGATAIGRLASKDEGVPIMTKAKNGSGTTENDDNGNSDTNHGKMNGDPLEHNSTHNSATEAVGVMEEIRGMIRDRRFDAAADDDLSEEDAAALEIWNNTMKGSVAAGFKLAMSAGPICEEPVRSVLIVLEAVEVALEKGQDGKYQCSKPLSGGMMLSALKSAIRCALLTRPARLVESHLKLTLHSSMAGLGPLYNVLSKRRGKVLDDSMVDGTDLILLTATLPHAEAFGLAPELFQKSSGEVTAPELIFSHWARFDEDPFWIPTSLEEREDFGEILNNGDLSTGMDNTALNYIRGVRQRKGLLVDSSRTVVAAEKQRTLKR